MIVFKSMQFMSAFYSAYRIRMRKGRQSGSNIPYTYPWRSRTQLATSMISCCSSQPESV